MQTGQHVGIGGETNVDGELMVSLVSIFEKTEATDTSAAAPPPSETARANFSSHAIRT